MIEEREILKRVACVLCLAVRLRDAFIKQHTQEHGVRRMCKVMQLRPSGYYAWKR